MVTGQRAQVDEILRPLIFMIDNAELDEISGDEAVDREDIVLASEALERLRMVYIAALELVDSTVGSIDDARLAVERRFVETLSNAVRGDLDRTDDVSGRYA